MKATLIKYAIKAAIAILQYSLSKVGKSSGKSGDKQSQTVVIDDLQINKETSKAFSEFIKKHTVQ